MLLIGDVYTKKWYVSFNFVCHEILVCLTFGIQHFKTLM